MVQGEYFKHITVTPPEEDDEVVFAGAVSAEDESDESENGSRTHSAESAPETSALLPNEFENRSPTHSPTHPTLEDLQGTPMSLTQKIVIAAALVCIIGAVIYYFAFMG